jgi:rubrerythrin
VSDVAHSRRDALRQAALGAGALAAAGLLRPALAGAQQTAADEDLRDFLVEAISLEQLAEVAYATAAREGDPDLRSTFERFRDQEGAHATALRAALDSLGFDPIPVPDSTTDSAAFEGVEGLSDEASKKRVNRLDELDRLSKPDQYLEYLDKLEAEQITFYTGSGSAVDSVDLVTTSAEIAGCQAQHTVVLRGALGDPPAEAAAGAANTAVEAVPAAS